MYTHSIYDSAGFCVIHVAGKVEGGNRRRKVRGLRERDPFVRLGLCTFNITLRAGD